MGSPKTVGYQAYCSELVRIYLEFDHGTFVIVEITVVRSRENGYNCGELLLSTPMVHFEPIGLSLVGSDYG